MIDRAELIAKATAAVCGPIIDDYQKGRLDGVDGKPAEQRLRELIAHRQPQIAAWMQDYAQRAVRRAARCCECGREATTVMGGNDFCAEHAKNHRMALPDKLGAAA